MLSCKANPVASFIFAVIFVFSLAWAVILKECTIRMLIRKAISTIRSRQHNSNSTSPLMNSLRFFLIPIQANLPQWTIFLHKKIAYVLLLANVLHM